MTCRIVQQSDEMYCSTCNMRWDTNDCDPPLCPVDNVQCPPSGVYSRPDPLPVIFQVGDLVQRARGSYLFPGQVRGVFTTTVGDLRYVVEHETEIGMLHIYSERDLVHRQTQQGR